MHLPDTDDFALWYALSRLITNYWAEVDGNEGIRAHKYYEPDGLYAVGANQFDGEANILAYYERRRERGNTTTRHVVDNLRVFREGARRARMVGTMSLYRSEGRPPIDEAKPLGMIADFEAQCLLGDDQNWRLRTHVLTPIFIGTNRPFSVAVDSERLRARS